MELWRTVPGYPGIYEVSNIGNVRSLDRIDSSGRTKYGKVLKQQILRGYPRVGLHKNGTSQNYKIAVLVLLAFVGELPSGMEVCHNNGNSLDSWLSNLRYDTHQANILDSVKHGTHHKAKVTECPKGHLYSPENTRTTVTKQGWQHRYCRTCEQISYQELKKRKKEESDGLHRAADALDCF